MSDRKSYFWPIVLVITLVLLLVCPFVVIYFSTSGYVSGEEFCADDFSRRRFSYNLIPIIEYPILGISYETQTGVLEQDLVLGGLIKALPANKWDLVWDSKSELKSIDFDARFLTNYLDLTDDDGANYFSTWNEKCPTSASIFWPIIADLARNGLYSSIPYLMRTALSTDTDNQADFHAFLDSSAAIAFRDRANLAQSKNNIPLSVELFSKSIDYSPTKSAYEGRSKSYSDSGDTDKSLADLESANGFGK